MARIFRILLIAVVLILPQSVLATIYKCVDFEGRVHFTDMLESEFCSPFDLSDSGPSYESGGSGLAILQHRAARFERHISYYGLIYNIDPHLIRAVIRTESAFNPKALSPKGAMGLMQLMPGTAKELKVSDPYDPEENISGGTRYLRSLLDTFQQDLRLALAAYNAGPTIVRKSWAVPEYPETIRYVKRVLTYYRKYKNGTA